MASLETDTAEAVNIAGGFPVADSPEHRKRINKRNLFGKTIFPKPPAFKQPADKFMKWLARFNEEQIGRLQLHLYRDYPVINRKLIGERKPKLIHLFEAELPFTSENYEDKIIKNREWGGSGKYKLMATQIGVPGCVSMCRFTLEDDDYPPMVDPRIVVVGHPLNTGYIEGLRAEGKELPGDKPAADKKKEEEEMTVGTVLSNLVESQKQTNERLMDKIDALQEEAEPDPDAAIAESASTKGFEVMAKATEKVIEVMGDQVKKANEAKSPVFNPIDLFEKAIAFSRADNSNMAMLTLFLNTQKDMHKETLDFMREQKKQEAKEAQQAAVIQVQQPANGFEALLDAGDKIKTFAELLGYSRRERREPEPPPAPEKSWFESWLSNPPVVMGTVALIGNLFYNMLNRGTPKSPQEALKEATQQAAELAKGVTGPNGTVTPIDQAEQQKRAMQAFMELIEPAFIAHYFDREGRSLDGFTFAEVFLTMRQTPNGTIAFVPDGPSTDMGMSQYELVKAGGMENFDRAIRNYHPIWSLVQGNISKYTTFLKQFFSYQEEAAKQAAGVQPN